MCPPVFGVIALLAAVLVTFLPETSNTPLPDTIEVQNHRLTHNPPLAPRGTSQRNSLNSYLLTNFFNILHMYIKVHILAPTKNSVTAGQLKFKKGEKKVILADYGLRMKQMFQQGRPFFMCIQPVHITQY